MQGEGGSDGGNACGMRVAAVMNAGQVGAVAMNAGRAAVVE